MRNTISHTFLMFCCCYMQQIWTVAVAQDLRESPRGETQAQQAAPKPGQVGANSSPALTGGRRPLYRLCKSDVLDIALTFTPEFNQTSTVRPDGFIALKGVEDLYVEGKTLAEVKATLQEAYAATLTEPEVTVTLKDFDKPHFVVSGEVSRPGKYELRSETTVTDALAIAGGLTSQSKHSQVVLFRRGPDEMFEAHLINVKNMLASRDLTEDLYLRPGDFVYVPQSLISKIKHFVPSSSVSAYMNPVQF